MLLILKTGFYLKNSHFNTDPDGLAMVVIDVDSIDYHVFESIKDHSPKIHLKLYMRRTLILDLGLGTWASLMCKMLSTLKLYQEN